MIYKSSDDGVRDEAGMSFCVYDCVCYVSVWCLCIVWYGENVSMNMMSMSKYEDGDGKLFRLVGIFFFCRLCLFGGVFSSSARNWLCLVLFVIAQVSLFKM